MKSIRPLPVLALTLVLFSFATALAGQSPAKPLSKRDDRFLFVINTSSDMSRRSEKMQSVAGNLMASGFKGEMKNGDTLGVWTYNDTLHTGQFPLKTWSSQSRETTAMALVEFIQNQKFEKRANITNVMESLAALTKISDRLTVLIFTDGTEKISGTPFDKEINEAYRLNESEQRKERAPFVVVLRSEKGKYIGHTVNVPPWAVEFPKFTPEPVVVVPPRSAPVEQVVVPSLIISNPLPRVEFVPESSPASELSHTNIASAIKPGEEPVAANSDSAKLNSGASSKIMSQPAEVHESGKSSAPHPVALVKQDSGINRILVWVAVVSVLLGAAGLVFALSQRNRSRNHISLITRSMDDDKK